MDTWITLLQTFGLATVILIFIAWGIVHVARWAAPRIEKLVDRVFSAAEHIDTFEGRVSRVEGQIENLWQFTLRRASVEAVVKGVGRMNSPLKINEEAKQLLGELSCELKSFYRRIGKTLSTAQLAAEIERLYGDEIVQKVCLPHGLFQGACLLIAMEVARDGEFERSGEVQAVSPG